MTELGGVLEIVGSWLDQAGVPWALVGGLAASARSEPRFTRDVDLAVTADSDAEAEHLVRDLVARGLRLESVVDQDATGRIAMVRLRSQGAAGVAVDLLFASSGVEADIAARAETLEVLPGVIVPVALLETPGRPQDRLDLVALRRVAQESDLEQASEAICAISERGCARGRDLEQALAAWWAAAPFQR